MDHALQKAGDRIVQVTGFDITEDGDFCEITTFSNYMGSGYSYSQDLLAALKKAFEPHLAELMQDRYCRFFLSELGIGTG